ncbi:CDC15_1 [Blepharisma stoltei]|uniref:non-specific serine/threonine protein kinase n=1 Tax=Blepharisma stoltei TaxID=1481888 RepID=A0AAU9ICJ5_9CILI|nr:unnamed protein product [Blepharisma stoltei]
MASTVQDMIGDYKILEIISTTTQETIYKAQNPQGIIVTLKLLMHETYTADLLQVFQNKISLLKAASHKHLLRYLDFFDTSTSFVVVYEYSSGILISDSIRWKGAFSENFVKKYTRQILKTLYYLHGIGVVHGQLGCDKIMLNEEGMLKIFDFGLGKRIDEKSAPEIKERKESQFSVDMWSLGYILLEIATGREGNKNELLRAGLDENFRSLVIQLLDEDYKTRITAEEVFEHPFLTKLRDSFINRHRRHEARTSYEEDEEDKNNETELELSPKLGEHSVRTQLTKTTRIGTSSANSPRGVVSNNHSFSFVSAGEQSFFLENLDLNSNRLVSSLETLVQVAIAKPETKESLPAYFINLKEIIEECEDSSVLNLCFKIIALASESTHEILEKICTSGLLCSLLQYVGDENEHEFRLSIAYILKQLFQFDDLIKMCLAAGALEALPLFLDADFENNKDLIFIAIDCMMPLRHNYDSLCIWGSFGTAERIVMTFSSLINEDLEYLQKTAELILTFARGPKAEHLCSKEILNLLLFSMRKAPDDILVLIIKSLRALAEKHANELENEGIMVDLVYYLNKSNPVVHEAIEAMLDLCGTSSARVEQLALANCIPELQKIIINESNDSQSALDLFCMFAATSQACRWKLRQAKSLGFMVKYLNDDNVIEALGKWIMQDPEVESEVLKPCNLDIIAERISQETRLIKWEGVLESSNTIRRALYEAVKKKGGNPRVLDLIKQVMNRYEN